MSVYTTGPIKVNKPLRTDIRIIRILICCGLGSMLIFLRWFIDADHIGYPLIFWLLTFAFSFKLLKMVHEWYHYWSPSVPEKPATTKDWKVDILTTACPGEPREMIIRTLKAMQAIRYPHTSYLCDEGDDPVLRETCQKLGVIHVTRTLKTDAKAGNINNALKQATGEICVVLDPDHEPVPDFLDRVLPYFEDDRIGYVQCVQAYGNQAESFIARGAAEQTYHFYGPMMMCMNTYGTVQAIGANCTFRRSALDSIGGHAAGLSEDMHTAMQLHAKGWKSVYIPEILTRGLVPATLSSYYKQQLKWSRGTFELLFRVLPKLYRNFTWRQKIHYITLPFYFLFGLINLIDIAVPFFALSLAEVPWEIHIGYFGLYFLPLCAISLIIRMFSQRWLVEKHERGFHLSGGILRMATWWIFLIGFIYTILKIRVPYIPTPKEDSHQNYVRLSLPNLLIVCLSFVFIYYGLSIDWSPYSFIMAFYSIFSAGMLGFVALMSQQKFLGELAGWGRNIPTLSFFALVSSSVSRKCQQAVYRLLQNGPVMLIATLSLILFSYSNGDAIGESESDRAEKELGGFYAGFENSALSNMNFSPNMRVVSCNWDQKNEAFPGNELGRLRDKGLVPFLFWHTNAEGDSAQKLFAAIRSGKYDKYLETCAEFFRGYGHPAFISFSAKDNVNTIIPSSEFILTWQYLYTFFNNLGISNLTWTWCPSTPDEEGYYPGEKFVDWIGVRCLNYAPSRDKNDWFSFRDIYSGYRKNYGKFQKPVMITEFGSAAGATQAEWFREGLKAIGSEFEEVKGLIVFEGTKKTLIYNHGKEAVFRTNFEQLAETRIVLEKGLSEKKLTTIFREQQKRMVTYTSPFVKGSPGHFQLLLNNEPYYIKGVAYNTAHDWRDGNMPLTRRQVEKDFEKIRNMGANTIRRYGTGIYDRNVLNIAEEYDLKVLYGFWFDPKIDYYSDSSKVEAYLREAEEKVMQFKDKPSVLAWSVGNESWGLLKHRFAKPYLTLVRKAYVNMIEQMAERIHKLDPTRPVFTCIEHEEYQLPGELVALRDGAPAFDAIGINSYYREQIRTLNHVVWQFDSLRPYLVSEFGPRGYWDPKYNQMKDRMVIEETDAEKASWYKEQWSTYVNGYKGYNIGGFAYCWHDRMEGSYTWFGLSDFKGRPKPSYYALKEAWTGKKTESPPQVSIQAPRAFKPGEEYVYRAIMPSSQTDLICEWHLLKNEYLDEMKVIDETDDPSAVKITIPDEPSLYRLYVYVSDDHKRWVTTASVPLKVERTGK
jgi:cellulose synthase (UDP-forming)